MAVFFKMQALGNDFVLVDARGQEMETFLLTPPEIRRWGDRHLGIGFDQLLILRPSDSAEARMEIYNADGSEAGMCGNGARCAAWWLMEQSGRPFTTLQIGERIVEARATGLFQVQVDLGEAKIDLEASTRASAWLGGDAVVVSVGNPHLVVFAPKSSRLERERVFTEAQTHLFPPEGCNVEWVEEVLPHRLTLSLFERGVGVTLACGSGACAAATAAGSKHLCLSPVTVSMPGGEVVVEVGKTVKLSGAVWFVFTGNME